MIRVLVADDQAMVRAGLRLILAAEPDIAVVGEASDGVEAMAAVRRLRPDVTLMDVRMPRLDGIAATRRLLAEDPAPTRVVVLTTFDVDSHVYDALRAGASGFLLKNAPPEDLVQEIRVVAAGAALIDPAVTRRVIEEFARSPTPGPVPPEVAGLTERELEVLHHVAQGLSNAEIAASLVNGPEIRFRMQAARPHEAKQCRRSRSRPDCVAYARSLPTSTCSRASSTSSSTRQAQAGCVKRRVNSGPLVGAHWALLWCLGRKYGDLDP